MNPPFLYLGTPLCGIVEKVFQYPLLLVGKERERENGFKGESVYGG